MTKTHKRVWINCLTAGGLLLALAGAGTTLTTTAGTSLYQTANPWLRIAREQARGECLEAQLRDTIRRMAVRDEIIEALCAGRLTLLEAAARFRDLNAECPDPRRAILTLVTHKFDTENQDLSYDECVCRNIIDYVRRAKDGEEANRLSPKGADVVPHLEEEYRQLLESGALHGPD